MDFELQYDGSTNCPQFVEYSWKSKQSGQTCVDFNCLIYITNNHANKYLVKRYKIK